MVDDNDVEETTLAVERLIDCVGKALDVRSADRNDYTYQFNTALDNLQEAFDDLMEKMRRAAR